MRTLKNPLISRFEDPFLDRLAKRYAVTTKPDHLTVLAILCSMAACLGYFVGDFLIPCLFIFFHYMMDGTDGKVAEIQGVSRKNGYYLDKVADLISSLFFLAGFTYATTNSSPEILKRSLLCLVVFAAYILIYRLKKVDVKIGGTEGRIILILLSIIQLS